MVVNIIVLMKRILKLGNADEDDILFGLIVISVSSVGLNVSTARTGTGL